MKKKTKIKSNLSETDIFKNIFMFVRLVFQQTIGIPMVLFLAISYFILMKQT